MTRLRSEDKTHRLGTRAIHAGRIDDQNAGAIMPPIYQTSTYRQEGLGLNKGYEYGRTQNPTREALERNVASLEGADFGFAFGSGLATLDAILKLFKAGDHIVCGDNVYGGTMRLMVRVYENLGLSFSFVDMRNAENVVAALRPATRLVYCETPTNPMMFLADLQAIGDICQAHGLLFAVDNTFASPIFQRPLELGADLVMHSTTKYLNGHSDMVGGIVVTKREDLAERLGFLQNASGAVPGPMDCWLALRGTKTLPLRMQRHDQNGRRIAEWLSTHKAVKKLYYPGLPSHPQHELAKRQMRGFGGMISFDVGDVDRARRILGATRIFSLAESLGGVESLIGHPASQTHASVPVAMREAMGLTDSLVRLSVGVEEVEDLIEDLDQAIG
ncbi:MAG: PLP-dependent aspartate aminotransferase family protein [Gemmatimonadales bacterium]|nr:PLP-dependent transferase [Gemmatimonadota bacterium]MDX2060895.1 PLP-dependent aspartate aminotransferase family protein [Gemmatimonadales bacterium]